MRTALILFIYIASYSISWLIFVNIYYNVIKPEFINYFYNRISDKWVSSTEAIYNNVETLILYDFVLGADDTILPILSHNNCNSTEAIGKQDI